MQFAESSANRNRMNGHSIAVVDIGPFKRVGFQDVLYTVRCTTLSNCSTVAIDQPVANLIKCFHLGNFHNLFAVKQSNPFRTKKFYVYNRIFKLSQKLYAIYVTSA